MGEQEQAVIPPVTIDEYGTMYRGERIVGDMVPVAEGADTYVIAVRDLRALLDALDAVPRDEHSGCAEVYQRIVRLSLEADSRAERAKRERDEALRRLDEAHLARIEAHAEPSRAEDCGKQLGCIYDPPCQRHGDPDRQEMLRQLDVALHGETWARPTSPSVVWRDLLGEVVSLARRRGEPSRAVGHEQPASFTCTCGHHRAQHTTSGCVPACFCTAFFDRAWSFDPQRCPRCRAQIHQNRRWGMRGEVCEDCEEPEPSRAEGDEQQRCYWCRNWLPSCWWDAEPNHECVHACDVGAMRRGEYFRAKADAEGGRREAEARGRELERECRMLAQRLLAKDDTLTREERERLISLKLGLLEGEGR